MSDLTTVHQLHEGDRVTDYERHQRAMCQDCGHDTRLMGEMYMLRADLWERIVLSRESGAYMLCIGCAEERLGRRLMSRDFIDCPLNSGEWSLITGRPQSLRLRHRLVLSATVHQLHEEKTT